MEVEGEVWKCFRQSPRSGYLTPAVIDDKLQSYLCE